MTADIRVVIITPISLTPAVSHSSTALANKVQYKVSCLSVRADLL